MITAAELIALVVDSESFVSWDSPVTDPDRGADYAADLQRARQKTGVDESILSGEARISGKRIALIVSEFGFLAGSLGMNASTRVVEAFQRATEEKIPVISAIASGGTRMQEGTPAFVSMVKIAAAAGAHKKAGLPYFVYLRNPSTGGALASFGSLGQVTIAEPGALVGFLGPRVYEALYGQKFPEGVQIAENLVKQGLIDGVVASENLRAVAGTVLNILTPSSRETIEHAAHAEPSSQNDSTPRTDTWNSIERTRDVSRPGLRELLRFAADQMVPLSGTGQGERDLGLTLCLVRFGPMSAILVGQDRKAQRALTPLGPGGLRAARRAVKLAAELGLPLVTVIDTPGASLSKEAEEGGLAFEIARCLEDLIEHEGVTLSVLLGEGTGGAALALLPADRTIAAQHSWLSPLPPEGASAIIYRDVAHAAELAEQQGVSASVLREAGIVDRIIPELPEAAAEPEAFCQRVGAVIAEELARLSLQPVQQRTHAKHQRYLKIGQNIA